MGIPSSREGLPLDGDSGKLSSVCRRSFLAGATIAAGGLSARRAWTNSEGFLRADVVITRAQEYNEKLEATVRRALVELGIGHDWTRGRTILLKPNLVEPVSTLPHITTNPALVRALVEVFRRWDAREVVIAEGPGHIRDTDHVLWESGLAPIINEGKIRFVDLNVDQVVTVPNRLGSSSLKELTLPRTVAQADRIVSIPKLKTHHWAGVTLSMKNLFGVMPGSAYGWPKNVFHQVGITSAILDIVATARPHLAIVDGIIGMEGDGPIMGSPRRADVLIIGRNPVAVDATAARLMGISPTDVEYLAKASGVLGPISAHHIVQRGEPVESLAQRFKTLEGVLPSRSV